jgi:hypothetical protein
MIAPLPRLFLLAALLGGCATGDPLEGQRTVFNNPYVPPQVDQRGIGPQCDVDIGRDATCIGGPVLYPGRGQGAVLGNGERVRLTRAQARLLRERAELREAGRNQPAPPPPPPPEPVLPTAEGDPATR